LVYQLSYVHTRLDERPWPGVTEKIRDDAIQAIRLAEDNLHQFCLRRIAVHLRTQHLNRAAHGSKRIANLVGNRGGHATDSSETILASRRLFETADLSKILKRDHHAGRFARLGRKRRDAVAESNTHALGCQTASLEARAVVALFQSAQGHGHMILQLAEKDRRVLAANRLFGITRDLLRGDVEGED